MKEGREGEYLIRISGARLGFHGGKLSNGKEG
jgi:hypothetical protein